MHGESLLRERLPRTHRLLEQGRAAGWHPGAQIHVHLAGQTVVDAAPGEDAPGHALTLEHRMPWLSAGKPVTAVALMQQVEEGRIDLAVPVAEYIPEFGSLGKETIRVEHLLTHTAGIRGADLGWKPQTWAEALEKIHAVRPEPRWEPGQKAGYHVDSLSYLQGELVRRVTGEAFSDYVRGHIFAPLGADASFLGLPEEEFPQLEKSIARLWDTSGPHAEEKTLYREPAVVALCRPGGNARGPARELGLFYQDLLGPAPRMLRRETVDAMTRRVRDGMFDQTFRHNLDWGLGFCLGSNRHGPETVPYGFGRHCSDRTFGHCGNQCSAGFADPVHGLVAVVCFNGQPGEAVHQPRMRDALTALYEDLGLAEPAR